MNQPLVSIIVPVYNGERTLERCLVSLCNQTYKNIEVLVIDDGSRDHTSVILEKYEKKDARIRVVHKKNTGVSDSRNVGIQEAKGKYLQFVDGDDWLTKEAIAHLVDRAERYECDMVISDFYRVVGRRIYKKGHIRKEGLISRKEYAESMMEAPANFYYGVMWNKFFRTDIVKQEELKCSLQLDWCEDFQFNLEYLQYADRIYVDRHAYYYYVKNKGSLVDTQVNFAQTVRTKRILFDYYKELYESIDLYEKNRLRINMFYLSFAKDKGKKVKTALPSERNMGSRFLAAEYGKKQENKVSHRKIG